MKKNNQSYDEREFESINISSIGIEDVRAVNYELILDFLVYAGFERENSPTTRMRKISALRSFYHYLYGKRHLVDSNPTTEISAPKKPHTLPKYMTTEESMRLLQTIIDDKESKTRDRDYAIVCVFLNTGMRLSELVGLNLKSFDSSKNSVTVFGKGGKERVVYLNQSAQNALMSYRNTRMSISNVKDSDALFLSARGTRISVKTVQWLVYKYLDMAGLGDRGLSTHKLRHTAATLMYQTGNVDIRVLKEILGHEQLNTTQIYTHVVDRNIEEAVTENGWAVFFEQDLLPSDNV